MTPLAEGTTLNHPLPALDQRRFKGFGSCKFKSVFNPTAFTFDGWSSVDMMAALLGRFKEAEGEPEAWEVRTRTELPA